MDDHDALRPAAPPHRQPDRRGSAHPRQEPIVVESPGYVAMTAEQRRDAISIFTEILAAWWRRYTDAPPFDPDDGQTPAPETNSAA